MNILIIDPSKTYQAALEKVFAPYSAKLFVQDSGAEGIAIYKSEVIHLICLSFYLSDMDGVAFVSKVRKMRWGKTLPILMITSKQSQDVTIKSLRDGVTEVFRKNDLESLKKFLLTNAEYVRQQANLIGNILLIDSDPNQVDAICRYFEETKLKFICFTTAEEATAIARAAEFDLVITNVVLDGPMSGMALIREIREINSTMYRVPILAITASDNVSQKIELLRAGANDSVQKPILLEELSVRVKNLLQNKKLFDTVEVQKIQLKDMAFKDALTGLFNRHHLFGIADRTLEDSYRHGYPVSLLVIDLDYFKKINDTHGHQTGDKVLQSVAQFLMRIFRGNDTPVRFGGEEFVILLPHCSGNNALTRAKSLRKQIEKLYPASIKITASIGVSCTPESKRIKYDDLFSAADDGVYQAKKNGRNTVCFISPIVTISSG